MNTPNESKRPSFSEEHGKLVRAFASRFISGNSVPVERTHITRAEWDAICAFVHEQDAIIDSWEARELDRSEPEQRETLDAAQPAQFPDDYREVMAKLSGPLRSIWCVMGPSVPRHWDCGGAAFEWGEALRILRDAANTAQPAQAGEAVGFDSDACVLQYGSSEQRDAAARRILARQAVGLLHPQPEQPASAVCKTCEGTGLANVVDQDDGALVIDDCPECGGESVQPASAVEDSDVPRITEDALIGHTILPVGTPCAFVVSMAQAACKAYLKQHTQSPAVSPPSVVAVAPEVAVSDEDVEQWERDVEKAAQAIREIANPKCVGEIACVEFAEAALESFASRIARGGERDAIFAFPGDAIAHVYRAKWDAERGCYVSIDPPMATHPLQQPVGHVRKHTGQFKDMAIIVWTNEQPPEGAALYLGPPEHSVAAAEPYPYRWRKPGDLWQYVRHPSREAFDEVLRDLKECGYEVERTGSHDAALAAHTAGNGGGA